MSSEMALTIRPSDLNDDQLQLAGLIGIDNFKKLVLTYGGMSLLTFPTITERQMPAHTLRPTVQPCWRVPRCCGRKSCPIMT